MQRTERHGGRDTSTERQRREILQYKRPASTHMYGASCRLAKRRDQCGRMEVRQRDAKPRWGCVTQLSPPHGHPQTHRVCGRAGCSTEWRRRCSSASHPFVFLCMLPTAHWWSYPVLSVHWALAVSHKLSNRGLSTQSITQTSKCCRLWSILGYTHRFRVFSHYRFIYWIGFKCFLLLCVALSCCSVALCINTKYILLTFLCRTGLQATSY